MPDDQYSALVRALMGKPNTSAPPNLSLLGSFLSSPPSRPTAGLAPPRAPTGNSLLAAFLPPQGNALTAPSRPAGGLFPSRAPTGNSLMGLFTESAPARAPVKRKTYFSFHYDDVMRVNNVRQAFRIYSPDVPGAITFTDSSLWESKKLTIPDSIKSLIRNGVWNTSVVCVLIGTATWRRRWVRYEIARAIIDGKGLLAVDINSLRHHEDRVAHAKGRNPLEAMAVGKMADGSYRLFELNYFDENGFFGWRWERYADYTQAVPLPKWMPDMATGHMRPLSHGTMRWDFVGNRGFNNIGGWIDAAAVRAGR